MDLFLPSQKPKKFKLSLELVSLENLTNDNFPVGTHAIDWLGTAFQMAQIARNRFVSKHLQTENHPENERDCVFCKHHLDEIDRIEKVVQTIKVESIGEIENG